MVDFTKEPIRSDLMPERLREKEEAPEEDNKNKNNS